MGDNNVGESYTKTVRTTPYMNSTVADRLKHHALTTPDKKAFIFRSVDGTRDVITCSEIYEQSVAFAKGLLTLGLKKGDCVGISFPNCRNWLISTFGSQIMGAITLCFKPDFDDGRDAIPILKYPGNCKAIIMDHVGDKLIEKILHNFPINGTSGKSLDSLVLPDIKFLVTDKQNKYTNHGCNVFSEVLQLGVNNTRTKLPETCPDDIATYLMTSGTTGAPKYIHKTHNQILNYGEGSVLAYELTTDDIFFNDRLFDWLGGVPVVYLVCGATHLTGSDQYATLKSIEQICDFTVDTIESEKCTVAKMFPVYILELLKRENTKHRMKMIGSSAVPVPAKCAQVIGRFSDAFVCHYGSSEMNLAAFKLVRKASDFTDYCSGKPTPGVEMKVVDKSGKTVKINETGELFIRNPRSFSGYFKRPDLTEEALDPDGWFKTDDSAFLNENGDFIVTGRCSDIILCYGAPLSPALIEDEMKKHPLVMEICVVRISDPVSFQKACICVVPREGSTLTVEDLEAFALKGIEGINKLLVMARKYIIFDKLPKTRTGKINRKEVMTLAENL